MVILVLKIVRGFETLSFKGYIFGISLVVFILGSFPLDFYSW